jgi:hypothetical protein
LDTVEAMIDGRIPKSSNDHDIPRFTWWNHRGTAEWVEWKFSQPRRVSAVEVYWFDDTGQGQCRVPKSWTLSYRVGDRWVPVDEATATGVRKDEFNRVTFKSVETSGLRLDVQLQPDFSSGILEWRAM